MGRIEKNLSAKLIISIFSQKDDIFKNIEEILSAKLGPVDFKTQLLSFHHTNYYEKEFGNNLKRKFLSFRKLINTENLWKIKKITNKIEIKHIRDNKRQFNLDPGYVTQSGLILASTKNYSHRIHIKDGIYQEVTLIFKDKAFQPLPWAYPDYQSKEYLDIFIKIRDILNVQLHSNAKLPKLL
jgi:hypothetical protein